MVHPIWKAYPEIAAGIEEVRKIIQSELKIKAPEIKSRIEEYINAPGKYMRAGLSLQFHLLKYGELTTDSYYTAAAIEVLHLATLIHDDVIDHSNLRRGIQALHISHSNRIAIYAGDYLLVYAGRLLAKRGFTDAKGVNISWVMESILSGEIQQLMHQHEENMTLNMYLKQIRGKTALLFALSAYSGYYDANQTPHANKLAFYIGEKIGMIFQLTDDLIDYQLTAQKSGKPQLQDVQNGIYTAPLLFAMANTHHDLSDLSREPQWTSQQLDQLIQIVREGKGIDATIDLIYRYYHKLIVQVQRLEGSKTRKAELLAVLEAMIHRDY